jgi:hypothetical protein
MNRSHYSRRLLFSAGVMAIFTFLGGCASAGSTTGHLVGHVFTQGGMDAKTQPAEAKLTATPDDGSANVVRTVDTAPDGSFSVDLPPGTYKLTGTLTTRIPGGQTSPQDVKITTGTTTDVKVYAIYP